MDRLLPCKKRTGPSDRRPTVSSPENGQLVKMKFQRDRRAACVGATWDDDQMSDVDKPKRRRVQAGVLVRRDLRTTLYADDELRDSSPLAVTALAQTVRLRLSCGVDGLDFLLGKLLRTCEGAPDEECDGPLRRAGHLCAVRVGLCWRREKELTLNWNAAPLGDAVADATACLALHAATSVPALRNAGPCCAPPATQRDGGAAAAALVRDALSDSFGEENVTDCEPADGDEQEYICLMKVVLDEQSATCGLVREGSEQRRRRRVGRRRAAKAAAEAARADSELCVPIPTSVGVNNADFTMLRFGNL